MKLNFRKLIFVALIFSVLGGGYVYIVVPAYLERHQLSADIQLKKRALADLAIAARTAEELNRQAGGVRLAIQRFTRKLPSQSTAKQTIDALTAAASHDDLAVESIDPGAIESLGDYNQQTVHFQLAGDCGAFYQYLQQVERMPHPVRVTQMSLHKMPLDGQITADLTVCLYFAPTARAESASTE